MENGEKREAIQENLGVIRRPLNEDNIIARNTRSGFYGGIDLRISKIRVISDNPMIIE